MTLDEIKQILDLVREHELSEFELEQEGVKLRVRKKGHDAPTMLMSPAHSLPMPVMAPAVGGAAPAPAEPAASEVTEAEGVELAVVKSPIVGTFYRAPEPTASPFVNVGDTVRKNQVLCLIEAMKLMNEIEADADGVIKAILIENGQPVEFDQPLFIIG